MSDSEVPRGLRRAGLIGALVMILSVTALASLDSWKRARSRHLASEWQQTGAFAGTDVTLRLAERLMRSYRVPLLISAAAGALLAMLWLAAEDEAEKHSRDSQRK